MASFSVVSFLSVLVLVCGPVQEHASSEDDPQIIVVEKAVVSLIDNIQIPCEEAGVVQEFGVREGDMVQEGQVIARLNSQVQRIQLEVSQAEVEAAQLAAANDADIQYAEKSTELARKTLERAVQANERSEKAVSKTELERLQLEFERGVLSRDQAKMNQAIAQAQMQVKRAELDATRLRLERREIRSPITGMVVERLAQRGEWINAGQPVIRVVRMDQLRLKCILPADSFDSSLVGKPVEFETSVPPNGETMRFRGRITFVSPEVILQRNEVAVWAEVENTDMKLRPNNSGTLRILAK